MKIVKDSVVYQYELPDVTEFKKKLDKDDIGICYVRSIEMDYFLSSELKEWTLFVGGDFEPPQILNNSAENCPIIFNNTVIGIVKNYSKNGFIECVLWDRFIDTEFKIDKDGNKVINYIYIGNKNNE